MSTDLHVMAQEDQSLRLGPSLPHRILPRRVPSSGAPGHLLPRGRRNRGSRRHFVDDTMAIARLRAVSEKQGPARVRGRSDMKFVLGRRRGDLRAIRAAAAGEGGQRRLVKAREFKSGPPTAATTGTRATARFPRSRRRTPPSSPPYGRCRPAGNSAVSRRRRCSATACSISPPTMPACSPSTPNPAISSGATSPNTKTDLTPSCVAGRFHAASRSRTTW